jgi:hypothetical protein
MGFYSRASMSSAPDEPPENIRLQRAFPFYRFLNRPVGFVSSISVFAKPDE